MGTPYARFIQALALAAAILGLLLTTPTLEARTKKASKPKKMKIVFDSSEPEANSGELGDEIVQPKMSHHSLSDPREVVHLRGSSLDEPFAKVRISKRAQTVHHRASPDLIAGPDDREIESSAHAAKHTSVGDSLVADESALGSFKLSAAVKPKKSSRHGHDKVKTQAVAKSQRSTSDLIASSPPPPSLPLEPVKVSSSQKARPIVQLEKPRSRIYLREVKPVLHEQTTVARPSSESSEFSFNVALENTTSAGRKYELETPGGRNFLMKNELFLGAHHVSDWGAKVSVDYIVTSNDDASKDLREIADPSLILEHPSFIDARDFKLTGFARYYLPVAAASKAVGLHHFAYTLQGAFHFGHGYDASNALTGRYYLQSQYADSDAFSLIEDRTEIGKGVTSWLRAGVGQRLEIESHQAIAPGTSVEVYPFAEFLALANASIQTRLYVPLFANGLVNGAPGSTSGPSGTGFSNLQAELFARFAF